MVLNILAQLVRSGALPVLLLAVTVFVAACGGELVEATPLPVAATPTTAATLPPPVATETTAPEPPTATVAMEPSATSTVVIVPTETATPQTAMPLNEMFPELGTLADVATLVIEEDWIGLSPLAPIEADFTLAREGAEFKGTADFAVASQSDNPSRAHQAITVPGDVMLQALELFAAAPVIEGKYEPRIDHTDDYPSKRILVPTSNGPLTIKTSSQGGDAVPWGVDYMGREFVVEDASPAEAMRLLDPYLARDVQQNLIDHLRNSP